MQDIRNCARCKKDFDRKAQPLAGTKYCGECRERGIAYDLTRANQGARSGEFSGMSTRFRAQQLRCSACGNLESLSPTETVECALCDTSIVRTAGSLRDPICKKCQKLLPDHVWHQFRQHHAPTTLIKAFIQNPHCQICGTTLTSKMKYGKGKYKSLLAIDHDHSCCDRQVSCGKCIRGYLCHGCNVSIGFMNDDITRMQSAVEYLNNATSWEPK